jgi:hypothetical protein
MTANGNQGANRQVAGQARQAPARVASSTRVAVAFPFSQVKIQERSDELVALTDLVADLADLVADLADLVAGSAADPRVGALRQRGRALAAHVR